SSPSSAWSAAVAASILPTSASRVVGGAISGALHAQRDRDARLSPGSPRDLLDAGQVDGDPAEDVAGTDDAQRTVVDADRGPLDEIAEVAGLAVEKLVLPLPQQPSCGE